jgi:hypothetical protein
LEAIELASGEKAAYRIATTLNQKPRQPPRAKSSDNAGWRDAAVLATWQVYETFLLRNPLVTDCIIIARTQYERRCRSVME